MQKFVDPGELEWIDRHGVRNHPDRVEVLMFQGEDRDAGQMSMQRKIIRPANSKARLGPPDWLFDKNTHNIQSEGRMVGLLPVRGTKQ